jgi:hypothetical protein
MLGAESTPVDCWLHNGSSQSNICVTLEYNVYKSMSKKNELIWSLQVYYQNKSSHCSVVLNWEKICVMEDILSLTFFLVCSLHSVKIKDQILEAISLLCYFLQTTHPLASTCEQTAPNAPCSYTADDICPGMWQTWFSIILLILYCKYHARLFNFPMPFLEKAM